MGRGQAWSIDLVIGVLIFLLVIGLFYALLTSNRDNDTTELKVASEVIATKIVSDQSGIVKDDTVDKKELMKLAEKASTPEGYEELKREFGIDTEFCIYFEDEFGNLINISNGTHTYAGIGPGSDDFNLSGTPCGQGKII